MSDLIVRAGMPYVSRVGDIRVRLSVKLSATRTLNYEGAVVICLGSEWEVETLLIGGEKVSPLADVDTKFVAGEIVRQLRGQQCPTGIPEVRGQRFWYGLKPDTISVVNQVYPDAVECVDPSQGGDLLLVEGDIDSSTLIGWKLISVCIRNKIGQPVFFQLKK